MLILILDLVENGGVFLVPFPLSAGCEGEEKTHTRKPCGETGVVQPVLNCHLWTVTGERHDLYLVSASEAWNLSVQLLTLFLN